MKSNQYPFLVLLVLVVSVACGVAEGPIEYTGPVVDDGSVFKRLDLPLGGGGSTSEDDAAGEGGRSP